MKIYRGAEQKKIYEMDTTYIVFLSLSGTFFLFSIGNTVLSIFNLSYAINNTILLCFALYAILFSLLTSSYVNPKVRSVGLFTLPLSITFLVSLATYFDVDLNGLNNGLSLIALSISIFLLPFRTSEEAVKRERNEKNIEEIADLKGEITRLQNEFKNERESLMETWKRTIDQLEDSVDDYRKLVSEKVLLQQELEKTKQDMSDLSVHHEYEKKDIIDEYELNLYDSGHYIEKLERQIDELKKQKEDA